MPLDRPPLALPAIVAAGRELVDEGGIDNLSLRRLAGRLDVSAPALYAHIASKDHLLRAIADGVGEQLVERFEAVDVADPVARLRALCAAHLELAAEAPALYAVLSRFPPAFVPAAADGFELRSVTQAFAILVAAANGAGCPDPTVAAVALWAATSGVASLLAPADAEAHSLSGQLGEEVARSVVEHLLAGFAGGVGFTPELGGDPGSR